MRILSSLAAIATFLRGVGAILGLRKASPKAEFAAEETKTIRQMSDEEWRKLYERYKNKPQA